MKTLEISNGKVYYYNEQLEKNPIDEISKEDILYILKKSLDSNFDYDEYNEEMINNNVHKIIYKDLHQVLSDFIANKDVMINEVNSMFKNTWEKYCLENICEVVQD